MSRLGLTMAGVLVTASVAAGCAGEPENAASQQDAAPKAGTSTAEPSTGESSGDGVPPGLLLPDEGEGASGPDTTAWKTDETISEEWLLDPCRPTAYPTDADRTGFRTVSRTGPELFQARQLAVYPTEDVAGEVMAGFDRALTACRTGGDAAQGKAWEWNVAPAEVGDEGFVVAGKAGGANAAPYGSRIAVTRVGAMVFLAYDEGEYGTAEIDDGARQAQQVAEEFVASR